jgi:signal transduction histidine kinase
MHDPVRRGSFKLTKGLIADGDANLLRVILNNLISNAWKYSAKQEESLIEFGIMEVDGKQYVGNIDDL